MLMHQPTGVVCGFNSITFTFRNKREFHGCTCIDDHSTQHESVIMYHDFFLTEIWSLSNYTPVNKKIIFFF